MYRAPTSMLGTYRKIKKYRVPIILQICLEKHGYEIEGGVQSTMQ